MNEHGLHRWDFEFDRAVRRAGACHYGSRTGKPKITLSRALMVNWAESEVRNIVLHEIAHALAGHAAGHGREWKRVARSIGCSGDRCWSPSDDAPALAKPWVGTCPTCKRQVQRHRRQQIACSRCCGGKFDARHLFEWNPATAM